MPNRSAKERQGIDSLWRTPYVQPSPSRRERALSKHTTGTGTLALI